VDSAPCVPASLLWKTDVPGLSRSSASQSDPSGLCPVEPFWNSRGRDLMIAVP